VRTLTRPEDEMLRISPDPVVAAPGECIVSLPANVAEALGDLPGNTLRQEALDQRSVGQSGRRANEGQCEEQHLDWPLRALADQREHQERYEGQHRPLGQRRGGQIAGSAQHRKIDQAQPLVSLEDDDAATDQKRPVAELVGIVERPDGTIRRR